MRETTGNYGETSPVGVFAAGVDVREVPVATDTSFEKAAVTDISGVSRDLRGTEGKPHIERAIRLMV